MTIHVPDGWLDDVIDFGEVQDERTHLPAQFRVGIIERGTNGPLIFNGLQFETWDEANEYGKELLSRWSGASAYRVEGIEVLS